MRQRVDVAADAGHCQTQLYFPGTALFTALWHAYTALFTQLYLPHSFIYQTQLYLLLYGIARDAIEQ